MNELVQYFLVNQDLKMKKGKIAGQVAHAATVYTVKEVEQWCDARRDLSDFYKWFNSVQKKIILKAPQSLLEELESKGFTAIRDKGYTQIPENSLTVVTIGVLSREVAENICPGVSELPLL